MKAFKIFTFCLLLFSGAAFSQYYNNGNYNNNRLGLDRNIARSYSTPKEATPEEIERDRNERVEKFVTTLKEKLKLDDLQEIVVRNELISNSKSIEIVMKKENANDEKSKEIKALMDKTEVVIKSYLNKDQKEKYVVLMEELKTNQKEKKGKKKDKEKDKEKTTEE